MLCFYFEGFKLNGFMLEYSRNLLTYHISTLEWTITECKDGYWTICWGVVYTVFQLQPFEGGHDADVALGEHEFDTPDLQGFDY